MVRADELYNEVTQDASGKGASQVSLKKITFIKSIFYVILVIFFYPGYVCRLFR